MYNIRAIVGKNLREIRNLRGITQAELASAAGISSKSISDIECGRTYPSPENLEALCKVLDRAPADFFLTSGQKDVSPEKLEYRKMMEELRQNILELFENELRK